VSQPPRNSAARQRKCQWRHRWRALGCVAVLDCIGALAGIVSLTRCRTPLGCLFARNEHGGHVMRITMARAARVALLCGAGVGGACGGEEPRNRPLGSDHADAAAPIDVAAPGHEAGADVGPSSGPEDDPLRSLPTGAAQLAALCRRGNRDPVAMAFCGASTP